MEFPLLRDLVIIFALSTAVIFGFHRLRIPTVVGFLLTGILVGPHGLGLISAVNEVELLAEIGVVLLLFTIGIEFSLKSLLQIRRALLIGGTLQGIITFAAVLVLVRSLGLPFRQAVFVGFLFTFSSTAIVLKLLQERAEIDSPHGKTSLAILIFQDIIIVPIMLITPILAGFEAPGGESVGVLLAKGIGVILLVLVCAQWVVPKLLYFVATTRSREVFVLSILIICFAVGWLTSSIGLSLALGAFLAGLIISESEYSYQALSNVLPFRDVFTSLFFVSIGMLLDTSFVFDHAGMIGGVTVAVLIIKTFTASFAALCMGFPLRTCILVGLCLSQIGEFAFVLALVGLAYQVMSEVVYNYFLSISIVTMAVTPFIIAGGSAIADLAMRLPVPERLRAGLYPMVERRPSIRDLHLKDHIIIVGFGLNGRNVARAAKIARIPYVAVEMNPETIRSERGRGEPIYYGDATQEVVLERTRIKEARVLIIVISDPGAIRKVCVLARQLNPNVYIICRTRFVSEMKQLHELGADEVIPEEFETSVEIFARVLMKYLIPKEEIERLVADVRADGYEMLRSIAQRPGTTCELLPLPDIEIITMRVQEGSEAVGKSLSRLAVRRNHGVTLLAILRDKTLLTSPDGDTVLHENDMLYLLGSPDKLALVNMLFRAPNK